MIPTGVIMNHNFDSSSMIVTLVADRQLSRESSIVCFSHPDQHYVQAINDTDDSLMMVINIMKTAQITLSCLILT